MLYVIDCNNARFYTTTEKKFIDSFPNAVGDTTLEDAKDNASYEGVYTFPYKREAVCWCLNHIDFYMEINPSRSKNLVKVMGRILSNVYNLGVRES